MDGGVRDYSYSGAGKARSADRAHYQFESQSNPRKCFTAATVRTESSSCGIWPRSSKITIVLPAMSWWNRAVAATPDDESRQFQLRDAVGESGGPQPLSPTLDERPAIAFAPGELTSANHQFRCNLAGIAIDIAQTLFHEAARKGVPHHPIDHGHPREIKSDGHRYGAGGVAVGVHENELFYAR